MREPEKMGWLRSRAGDIPAPAIQEMVRIASPFIHFVRTARRDVSLHGKEIAAGERVAIAAPRTFDLEREPNPHFGFGKGPHACLGKHVAALEMKVLFEELLQRTQGISPAGEISYVRDTSPRGVYELPVTVTPARASARAIGA